MNVARFVLPAARWPADGDPAALWPAVERALEADVAGFIVFGGDAEGVRAWTNGVRARAGRPLLLAADAERGAGQQFGGTTSLPPPRALGALPEGLDAVRGAARITARELLEVGLNWALAPVADLDLEAENPIVGTRSFGAEPAQVCECVRAWVRECQSVGALACAKHFPGHGRTTSDSHLELPEVGAGRGSLEADWAPFRAAIDAGVASVMAAHVAYPALDPTLAPASLSRPILSGLLRETFGFDGLVVSDALMMAGVRKHARSEPEAAVRALEAGTDLLLYPSDWQGVVRGVEEALRRKRLAPGALERSFQRIERAVRSAAPPVPPSARGPHADWALAAARQAIVPVAWDGPPRARPERVEVAVVDDDRIEAAPEATAAIASAEPPPGPSRDAFFRTLAARGYAKVTALEDSEPWRGAGEPVIACFAEVRAYKGRAGLSREAQSAVARRLRHRPEATLLLFGHPRLGGRWPHARNVACAWSGDEVMQRAAAHWLADVWEGADSGRGGRGG